MGGSCSRRSAQDRSDLNPAGGYLDTTASGANMNPYFMDPSAQFGGIDRQVGFLIANGLSLAPENVRNSRKILVDWRFFLFFIGGFTIFLRICTELRSKTLSCARVTAATVHVLRGLIRILHS